MKAIQVLAIVSASSVYILIYIGGLVTRAGLGLSAGIDWPIPAQGLFPDTENFLEYLHRAWSGVVGLFILGTAIFAWKRRSRISRIALTTSFVTVVLVGVQIILGALVLQSYLHPVVVAAHNNLASAIFATSIATVLLVSMPQKVPLQHGVPRE